ncbi:MAG TPA: DUF2169 domain-containing protein [Acetobacteraceae bacterium]|nr:DUF2169 domain-containing protein [Acetobacteraceae bacterium]
MPPETPLPLARPAAVPTSGRVDGRTILLPGQSPDGAHVLSVLVKRTYAIRPGGLVCLRLAQDRPLVAGDEHFGDPMNTTVRYESDFVPWKLATDVVLNGSAYAPGGEPVQELLAGLAVGGRWVKQVLILGDRTAHHRGDGKTPTFGDPAPFASMPIRYERAFGGVDVRSDPSLAAAFGRNHLGRGFVVRNARETVEGLPLPNIEDPADRLTPERLCCGHFVYMDALPAPCGFGWTMKYWRPRALLAGVMPADAALARELRAAYRRVVPPAQRAMYDETELPAMDFRFFNGASDGLVLPYLAGDEAVRIRNLSPEGDLAFRLPGERPRIALDIGFGAAVPKVVLHTVMIRMEERELDLVWRGAVAYPGPDWLPEMRRLDLEVV